MSMRLLCLLSLLAATVAFKIAGTRLARATFPPGPLFAQGGGWSSGGNGKGNGKTAQAEEELARLLAISSAEGRGAQSSLETLDAIAATILILEGANPTKEPVNSELIDGCWKLLYTSSPGTNSPIQKTFTAFNGVSIYQVVNLIDQTGSFLSGKRDVSNTVCFGDRARLRVTALASTPTQPLITPRKGDGKILGMNIFGISSSALPRTPLERIDFAFQEAMFEFKGFGESGLKPPSIPYPVPFKLLGDEAKGWLDSTYLSPRFRISKGNKGTTFVLERADMADPTAIFATEKLDKSVKAGAGTAGAIQVQVGTGAGATAPRPPPPRISFGDPFSSFKTLFAPKTQSQKGNKASSRRVAIIFPAQLGTGADYTDLVEAIAQETRQGGTGLGQGGQGMGQGTGMGGVKAYVAPLSRINWPLGLLPSFFSPDYAMATLQPSKVLQFYFRRVDEAVDRALREAQEEGEGGDIEITLVGHSIGGWIARAWLSEHCAPTIRSRVTGLVTLGSPHNPPPATATFASLDQTRGLLSYINENFPGAYESNVRYVSVIGSQVAGSLSLKDPQALLAYGSYIFLGGDGEAQGDGIIPVQTASLPGSQAVVLEGVRHTNYLPTPLDSVKLPWTWYGSQEVVAQWLPLVLAPLNSKL